MNAINEFDAALALHQAGNLVDAIKRYQAILANDPDHADAWHCLGLALAQNNQYQAAKDAIQKAIALNPTAPHYFNNLGNTLKALGALDAAVSALETAIQLQPNYAEAHNNLGTVHYQQQIWQAAFTEFNHAIHHKTHYVEAHRNLGLTLLQLGEVAAAIRQFQNVLQLHPVDWQAHFQLGNYHLQNEQLDNAIHHYQQVLSSKSDHIETLINLGAIYCKQNEPQRAMDYFTEVLLIDSDNLTAKHNCAAIFMQTQLYDNAKVHYQEILAVNPEDQEALFNIAVASMSLGEFALAKQYYLTLLKLAPLHFAALTNLGILYMQLQDKEQAIEQLTRAQSISPDPNTQFMLDALMGKPTVTVAPTSYVENLFDHYAKHYNLHLKNTLQYSLPEKLRSLFDEVPHPEKIDILDLGCGTGLCGVAFADCKRSLVGIDLSHAMIAAAKNLDIYDALLVGDLSLLLNGINESYDLIIAGEVFEYIGDLSPIFKLCQQHLNKSGYLLFSTEISQQEPIQLQKTARFAHHPEYLRQTLMENGFRTVKEQTVPIRMQEGLPFIVSIVLAQT